MKLNRISICNFRCFERMEVELHPHMNVIIGNNGVGKSSLLDAISIGIGSMLLGIDSVVSPSIKKEDVRFVSYELGSTIDRQPQFSVSITCDGIINDQKLHWSRQLNTENGRTTTGEASSIRKIASDWQDEIRAGNTKVALPLIFHYSTGRLWAQKREKQERSQMPILNRFQGYTDCLAVMSNQKLMLRWFERMTLIELQEGRNLPELTAVKKAVAECYLESGTDAVDVKVHFNVRSHQLEIVYRDGSGEWHKHPFHELSDGYRNTLSLVADIAYRMALLNPQFLDDVIKKTSGIVLIDEIDLHLHPIWQKRILKTLQSIFPCVQFIVTTHSPTVISSANGEQILILDGKNCYSHSYEVYGKDVNSVLSEVMGTSARPDEMEKLFAEFNTYLDDENIDKAKETLKQLRELLGDHDNGVISAEVALDFAQD